jgi:hypothetical protein
MVVLSDQRSTGRFGGAAGTLGYSLACGGNTYESIDYMQLHTIVHQITINERKKRSVIG